MNERIQLLAQQAKDSIPQGTLSVPNWIEAYNQKFAELIIQDVLQTCNRVNKGFNDWSEHHAIDSMQRQIGVNILRVAIREHFGVYE